VTVDAPLISLAPLTAEEAYAREVADWPHVYVCPEPYTYVPVEVRQAGKYYRHVVRCGYFGVQLGWEVSDDMQRWIFVLRTDWDVDVAPI
jgi:hypothetical protein